MDASLSPAPAEAPDARPRRKRGGVCESVCKAAPDVEKDRRQEKKKRQRAGTDADADAPGSHALAASPKALTVGGIY